jgi:hypothetical protein
VFLAAVRGNPIIKPTHHGVRPRRDGDVTTVTGNAVTLQHHSRGKANPAASRFMSVFKGLAVDGRSVTRRASRRHDGSGRGATF